MFDNQQRPIAADHRDNGTLQIHHHFVTIQGEGPLCGERALFIRLFGCNLRCPGCDTDYTSTKNEVTSEWMLTTAKACNWPQGALIVITGGEPLRQNIVPSVLRLLSAGYRVQVETNGAICPDGLPWADRRFMVVCSPKTSRISNEVLQKAHAFKYVLRHGEVNEADGLPLRALCHAATPEVARPRPGALVFVQPMDEGDAAANAMNLQAAISSTMTHGYRLQIQVHKQINME